MPFTTAKRLQALIPVAGFAGLLALGRIVPAIDAILNLALPFFGLIGLGFICGKLMDIPEDGLRWMNFFIVYVSLPALFYNLISVTPFEQLSNWPFVLATTVSTYIAYALSFGLGMWATGGGIRQAAIAGLAGSYSNIGYMGPGLTLAALGAQAAVPTALIFVFDSILFFSLVPFLMALGGNDAADLRQLARTVAFRVLTHPFNIATAAGVFGAYAQLHPPVAVAKMLTFLQNAAAPSALFVLGVTVAMRPMRRVAVELPGLLVIKLVLHHLLVWAALSWIGDFGRVWTFTAVLMAALPPALNVFVMASQYQEYVERASSAILIGTVVSVVTVTALLYGIAGGFLPTRLFGN